jgi:hypothetical protein
LAVTVVRAVPDDSSLLAAGPGPGSAQVVLVASRPAADLPAGDPEVVLMNGWPGAAGALNAGIRRARGAIVVIAAPEEPMTDSDLAQLTDALADPTVAVAGPHGWTSEDLRRFDPASAGDAVAIDGRMLAFRRKDFVARGPLDEAFVDPYRLDAWWSLVLRDEGLDAPPRRAVVLAGAQRAAPGRDEAEGEPAGSDAAEDEPVAPAGQARRRNFYRVVRHFGGARHLVREAALDG